MGESAGERRPTKTRLLGALAGAGLVVVVAGAFVALQSVDGGGDSTAAASQPAPDEIPPLVSTKSLQQLTGVRITHVAVSGAGGLVDVRYQIVDPERAAVVHETSPGLVDETTGVVVDDLFMGHKHKGVLHAGQTYFLLFENPGNLVQRGTRVTVVLGGVRVPHVDVQ